MFNSISCLALYILLLFFLFECKGVHKSCETSAHWEYSDFLNFPIAGFYSPSIGFIRKNLLYKLLFQHCYHRVCNDWLIDWLVLMTCWPIWDLSIVVDTVLMCTGVRQFKKQVIRKKFEREKYWRREIFVMIPGKKFLYIICTDFFIICCS